MKPWHWILIALILIVIIFAVYAINQANKAPKVIVKQAEPATKAGIWDVVTNITDLFKDKQKAETTSTEFGGASEMGPPTYDQYLNQ